MKIFDTHAHYNDAKFDEDRDTLLQKIYDSGVDRVVLIGASLEDSISEKETYLKYINNNFVPKMYLCVGCHPDEVPNFSPDSGDGNAYLNRIEKLCKNENGSLDAIAFGEIGLDYFGDSKNEKNFENQKNWFIAFLNLSKKLNLPICVHSRDACMDTLNIIKEYGKELRGIIHCFSYEKEIAKQYVDMGFMIGIGGTVTFKNNRKTKEVVETIPLSNIVTETDSPYLSPEPFRGKRNDSSYIKYVIEEIARIKKCDIETVASAVYDNAMKLFNIKNY